MSVLRGGSPDPLSIATIASENDREQRTHSNPHDGTYLPFIDDYIHISDPIIDYLTAFSGISPGDLDPKTSPYVSMGRLVSLKTAYKKIWLLLNLGVVFVGHGLLKDFRTINIHVPKKQVVDTVDLFFIKSRQRKLSLRFLAWCLLEGKDKEIQGGMHDSVEDARTALRLWEKWKEFESNGVVEKKVEEIYRRGRDLRYKPPVRQEDESENGRQTPTMLGVGHSEIGESSAPGTPAGRSAGLVSATAMLDGSEE